MTDWAAVLGRLSARHDLTSEQAAWAMSQVMSGQATPAQIAALAIALRVKGEAVAELTGMVEAILDNAVRVPLSAPAVDVVGTGGDGAHTVNISTMAAFVVAGCGVPVLKHGNRAISSKSGTADVLEALGVAVDLPPALVSTCLAQAGMAFCFAPAHHPGFRHAGPVRRELGVATVFNVLGPLCNPGQPAAALLGCADVRMAPLLAHVQCERGFSAIVVRSDEGLDEIGTMGTTQVWDATTHEVRHEVLDADHLGLLAATVEDLRGDDAAHNAEVARAVLSGRADGRFARVRDVVRVNAAAALVAFDATRAEHRYGSPQESFVARLRAALPDTAACVDSGAAAAVLASLAEVSTTLARAQA